MRESGSSPNVPGDTPEERLPQRPVNLQQPSKRSYKLPPRAVQSGRSRQRTRPIASPRGKKAAIPLQPPLQSKLRSLDSVRPNWAGDRAANSRTANRQRAGLFGNRQPEVAPEAKAGRRKRNPRSYSTPQASAKPIAPKPPRPRTRSAAALLYGTRLLILGVGVGVITGTILSVWDPARNFTAGASQSEKTEKITSTPSVEVPTLRLDQEILPLKTQIQALVAQQPQLTAGIMVVDLDTNAFLNVNATATLPGASTIKLPVLVAFFQDVDAGKIRLDELLTMRPELVATESGEMQYQPPESQFTALETATKMITISDNTATNMLIDRLGGKDALNQRFQSWGLTSTTIHNLLPDVEGTNTSSSQDLVTVLGLVSNGKLLSIRSRDRVLDILRHTVTNTLLPSGLGEGAMIAHKTGNIGTLTGDVGVVDVPNGKRYLMSVLVKRPRNGEHGEELIREASRLTYQYFSQPAPSPGTVPGQTNPVPSNSPQGTIQPRSKIAQP